MNILIALLLSISINLDNIIYGISYGKLKIKLSLAKVLIISLITTIITALFIYLGNIMSSIISLEFAKIIGGSIPILLGIYSIILEIYRNDDYKEIIELNILQTIILGLSLSINNIPLAISGGISNVDVILSAIFSFIISSAFIVLGNNIGMKIKSKIISILASILFILMGILEIFIA